MEDGLSQSTALALLQDRRGFLWIATQDGVNRYDGSTIRPLLHTSAPPDTARRVVDHFFRAMAEDSQGRLWLGTAAAGVYVTDRDGRVLARPRPPRSAHPLAEDRIEERIYAFAALPEGGMLVASSAGLLVGDSAARRLTPLAGPDVVPDSADATAVALEGATVWAGYADGTLARARRTRAVGGPLDLDEWETIDLGAPIRTVTRGPDGRLWAGTLGAGLFVVEDTGDGLRVVREVAVGEVDADGEWTLPSQYVTAVEFDSHGEQWVGTWNGLARRPRGSRRFRVYRRSALDPRGLRNSEIHSLLEDRDGVLWIGTTDGVNALSPYRHAFDLYMDPGAGEVAPMRTRALLGGEEGVVWAGTRDSELVRIETATARVEMVLDLKPLAPTDNLAGIHDLEHDGRGGLWIATLGAGLVHHVPGREPRFHKAEPLDPRSLPHDDLESVLLASDGTLWLGSNTSSLIRYEGGRFERYERLPDVGELPSYVWPIVEEPDGTLWIGTFGGGLYRLSADRASGAHWKLGEDPDIAANRILSLNRAADGALWIGTQGGGVFRLDPDGEGLRRWTAADGLPHDHVQAILEDGRGTVWASTSAGLGRYTPETDRWLTFDVRDGLQADRFYAGAAWKSPDGVLFFGGERGVTAVHPERLAPRGDAPPPVITEIRVEGRRHRTPAPDSVARLRLHHTENAVTFRFVELDFENPERNRFEYRLVGAEDVWVAGGRDWNARFAGLRPGRYAFELRATNGSRVWSDVVRVPLEVRPPYWATLWFRALVIAALVSLGWMLYVWRTRQQLAVERLRFGIASRLHDDIGASLSSIAMRTELLGGRAGDPSLRAQLGDVAAAARGSAERLREMVWVVRSQHDTAESLRARIEETAQELLGGLHEYRVSVRGLDRDVEIGMELRQDAHLLVKEAIHNAARHAGATRVEIELSSDGRDLVMIVRDDGRGFDPDSSPGCGNGLALMADHAERHGGDFEIRSVPGEGTEVRARIPL